MADKSLFSRLRRLFSTNVIVRNVGGKRLRVSDTSRTQSTAKSNLIDRYQKIFTGAGLSGYSDSLLTKSMRLNLFKDYESMDSDAIISSALDIYADESTMKSEYGEVLEIRTDNNQIKEILHNLFYDIVNIEFNLWPWVRNMCKYGDFFLQLEINEKYGITNVVPLSVYDVSRLEGMDPDNPEYVKYLIESATSEHRYKPERSATREELENYEVAHFRLLSDSNYLPYGKSQIEGGRKIWKQLTLMEDAMLIHRIMRAPEKRIFKLDIGNIPPTEVDNYMQQVINKMKKAPVVDDNGDYNLKYNMQNITEDFFLPVRGGDSGTEIETLPGLTNEGNIEDVNYLKEKMMAALKVPKAFLGYEEGIGSKATLAAEDVRFARTIERTKIAIVHLYTQGFNDSDLLEFELELTNPSMIHEQEKLELLSQQTDIANSLMENKLMSREWIYDNIYDLNQGEKQKVFKGIIEDQKQAYRMEQISMEGNDPVQSGQDANQGEVEEAKGEWGGDRRSGTEEKEYGNEYDSDDVKDSVKYEREKSGKRQFKGGSPLYPGKGGTIVKKEGLLNQLKKSFGKNINSIGILNEESILDDKK